MAVSQFIASAIDAEGLLKAFEPMSDELKLLQEGFFKKEGPSGPLGDRIYCDYDRLIFSTERYT